MEGVAATTPRRRSRAELFKKHNAKLRLLLASLAAVVLFYVAKNFVTLEVKTVPFDPEFEERVRRGEVDITPEMAARTDKKLLKENGPLYDIMLGRVEMSNAQRRKRIQRVVDEQLAPYFEANRTFTSQDVARLKAKNNFAMRVIVDGDNLTIVQTEQEKDNWSYWYRMDQTAIALKAMRSVGMLPYKFDLVVNLQDEPNMSTRDFELGLPPLFSYCSSGRYLDLLWVGWQYWRCLSKRYWEDWMAGDECQVPWNVEESTLTHPWESRVAQALWRGSPTGRVYTETNWREKPRPILVSLSQNHSDILNCTMSACQPGQCTPEAEQAMNETLGFSQMLLKQDDYLRHKYLVDVDGNSYSSRFPKLLSSGSLIFKQASKYREFLDIFFTPGRHYVRVKETFGNLIGELEYAKHNDRESELMAARALSMMHYIIENDVVFEYLEKLIGEYSKLLRWDDDEKQDPGER